MGCEGFAPVDWAKQQLETISSSKIACAIVTILCCILIIIVTAVALTSYGSAEKRQNQTLSTPQISTYEEYKPNDAPNFDKVPGWDRPLILQPLTPGNYTLNINDSIPGGLKRDETPQLVYFSFDDAVTPVVYTFYQGLFGGKYRNPNGCPIRATFNVCNVSNSYELMKKLYEAGHEIASHSISHRVPPAWWARASYELWGNEIDGFRRLSSSLAGIPGSEIRGMRTPFLAVGGDVQFSMLKDKQFTYDATMTTFSKQTQAPLWPFNLRFPPAYVQCSGYQYPCPTKSYPDLWEIPLNKLYFCPRSPRVGLPMIDSCHTETFAEALHYVRANFYRHYNAPTRPPFGLNMHAAWFAWEHNLEAMHTFLEELSEKKDVWIVPALKLLDWIANPTPVDRMDTLESFHC